MPEHLGEFYVRVNIPNFNLDIYKNGKVFYTTRIVVGQADQADADLLRRDRARHRQPDVERAGFDRDQGDAAADPGQPRRGAQRLSGLRQYRRALPRRRSVHGRLAQRRHAQDPDQAAAGRAQRARLDQVHVPQPVRRLPARHAVQEPVPAGLPRLQPRLHAGHEPLGFRRRAAHLRPECLGRQAEEAGRRARNSR